MKILPWREIFQSAFCHLKLSPQQLWQMTPKELTLILEAQQPNHQSINQEELNHLIAKFK